MIMTTLLTRRRLRAAFFVTATAIITWLIYDPCYCSWARFGRESWTTPLHLKSLPRGCEVLVVPEQWQTPENDPIRQTIVSVTSEGGEMFSELEFRSLRERTDEVLFALRSRGEAEDFHVTPRNSKQKYAFHFPALAGHPEQKIHGLRQISEEEWNRGKLMPLVWDDKGQESEFAESEIHDSPIVYQGKTFRKSNLFYWFTPAMLSAGKQHLAVFSYGKTRMKGNAAMDPDWLFPPWRSFTIDFYNVSSGAAIRLVRAWSCIGGEFNHAEWHGDDIFSMPLEPSARQLLVCGFR
jgi:hypothetical protein